MKLLFYSELTGPRIDYVIKALFEDIAGCQLVRTTDPGFFTNSGLPRIQYGGKPLKVRSFYIPSHLLMQEGHISPQTIEVKTVRQLPAFFHCPGVEADLPFDFLAMAFYLISRYEEYLPFEADVHGRFVAQRSLAFQKQFLRQPLIDQWLKIIIEQLATRFEVPIPDAKKYKAVATIDVDFAWAYLHKNAWRTTGGLLKDLLTGKWNQVRDRLAVLNGFKDDPYDQFEWLKKIHLSKPNKALYFFLFGAYGSYDKNTSPQHPAMQQLVQKIAQDFEIGIHPSYASNNDSAQLAKEKNDLSHTSNQSIVLSRQHFLKLSFPKTYQNLLALDIEADYSMGYAEDVGFRASTAHPFFWYDLQNETTTKLKVYPFQVMDVTLKNYLKLSPQSAIDLCQQIIDQVQAVDGTFISIWHNSSFSSLMGWTGWKKVYEQLIEEARR